MKKILITGNLGYIGPVLTSHLLKHGDYEIHGYDLGWFEYCSPHNILEARPFKQTYKDIRDISADDLDGIDGVFIYVLYQMTQWVKNLNLQLMK